MLSCTVWHAYYIIISFYAAVHVIDQSQYRNLSGTYLQGEGRKEECLAKVLKCYCAALDFSLFWSCYIWLIKLISLLVCTNVSKISLFVVTDYGLHPPSLVQQIEKVHVCNYDFVHNVSVTYTSSSLLLLMVWRKCTWSMSW